MADNPIYHTKEWQTARRATLIRDAGICRLRLPGCTLTATQVDHIRELADNGAPYDLSNLQASCRHCNVMKEHRRRNGNERPPLPPSRDW